MDRIRHAACLSDEVLEGFEDKKFCISESEASRMDPGHKLLSTVAHEVFTDAGIDIANYERSPSWCLCRSTKSISVYLPLDFKALLAQ